MGHVLGAIGEGKHTIAWIRSLNDFHIALLPVVISLLSAGAFAANDGD